MSQTTPLSELTPQKIVEQLDKYIVGQTAAKKAVAVALRNRWRRARVEPEMRREIMPNNIIMIGPTGVGKTEIARRLADLAGAPFIKVEASKFTEVGYVGRDVESMIRELMEVAVNLTRNQMLATVKAKARVNARELVLDKLISPPARPGYDDPLAMQQYEETKAHYMRSREKMGEMLDKGKLDEREIEVEQEARKPQVEVMSNFGLEQLDVNFGEMLANFLPKRGEKKVKVMKVAKAWDYFTQQEASRLVDKDRVIELAKESAQNHGIIFIDEIDKIATQDGRQGADVSRSGVQRDLLPIVEGSSVPTKYGVIKTDHMLFIAAGAFHMAKPSDLVPELQGRFPIRVELDSLTKNDFVKILKIPRNALIKQYQAMFASEGVTLNFTDTAIAALAEFAGTANEKMQDIGARRLYTVLNTLMEDYLFEMPEKKTAKLTINAKMVEKRLGAVLSDEDLQRYIL